MSPAAGEWTAGNPRCVGPADAAPDHGGHPGPGGREEQRLPAQDHGPAQGGGPQP